MEATRGIPGNKEKKKGPLDIPEDCPFFLVTSDRLRSGDQLISEGGQCGVTKGRVTAYINRGGIPCCEPLDRKLQGTSQLTVPLALQHAGLSYLPAPLKKYSVHAEKKTTGNFILQQEYILILQNKFQVSCKTLVCSASLTVDLGGSVSSSGLDCATGVKIFWLCCNI